MCCHFGRWHPSRTDLWPKGFCQAFWRGTPNQLQILIYPLISLILCASLEQNPQFESVNMIFMFSEFILTLSDGSCEFVVAFFWVLGVLCGLFLLASLCLRGLLNPCQSGKFVVLFVSWCLRGQIFLKIFRFFPLTFRPLFWPGNEGAQKPPKNLNFRSKTQMYPWKSRFSAPAESQNPYFGSSE